MTKKHKQTKPQKDLFEAQADHMRHITGLVEKLNNAVRSATFDNVFTKFDFSSPGISYVRDIECSDIRIAFSTVPKTAEGK